jgi:hypothetical protein
MYLQPNNGIWIGFVIQKGLAARLVARLLSIHVQLS